MEWHEIRKLLGENDGASICPQGRVEVSDLIARMIDKSTFKNRYYTTFTYPRTKTIYGSDLDHHELISQFITFLGKFSELRDNHLLPIFAYEPPGGGQHRKQHGILGHRFHIHAILLAEKEIKPDDWNLLVSTAAETKQDIKELKKDYLHKSRIEAARKEKELGRRMTQKENDAFEARWDFVEKQAIEQAKRLNKLKIGNRQRTKHFEQYDPNRKKEEWKTQSGEGKVNPIGYIFGNHLQATAYVFCPGSCPKGKCSERVPFTGLTSEMKKTRVFRGLSGQREK